MVDIRDVNVIQDCVNWLEQPTRTILARSMPENKIARHVPLSKCNADRGLQGLV